MEEAMNKLNHAFKLSLFIIVLFLLIACGNLQPESSSVTESTTISTKSPEIETNSVPDMSSSLDQLQVVGNKIVNENGEVVVLRGYGINDPILLSDGRFEEDPNWTVALFREVHDWGATIVRLPIHPPNFKKDEAEALEILDQAIQWADMNDLYVIIDYHAFAFPPREFLAKLCYETCTAATMADTIHFWQVVSERYAGNNTVAFYEIFNEPASHPWTAGIQENQEDWLIWRDFNELVIDMIRVNDPDTIVLSSGLSFSKDQSFILAYPVERGNVAYAVHHNPTSSWKFGEIADHFPVVVTEVSFTLGLTGSEAYSNESKHNGSQLYRYDVTDLMIEKDMSWTVAAFAPSWGGFTMIEDGSFKPTETGLFWKEFITGLDHQITTGERISEDRNAFSAAVGKWKSSDPSDGRSLSLVILDQSDNKYQIRFDDEVVPLCGKTQYGQPRWGGRARGEGKAFFNKLDVGPLNIECDNETNFVGGLYFNSFVHDPETDTLTDIFGSTWTRIE
jgi:hypothetical protein